MTDFDMFRITYMSRKIENLDEPSLKLLDEILDLLKEIDGKKDELIKIWLSVERGSYEDYKRQVEQDDLDIDEQNFYAYCPDKKIWFRLLAIEDSWMKYLCIGRFQIVIKKEKSFMRDGFSYDCSEILSWTKERIQEVLSKLRDGSYNEEVNNELPYEFRYGTIVRKEFWDVYPDKRLSTYGNVTEEEKNEFLSYIKSEGTDSIPKNKIKDMTFTKYFDMVYPCYKEMGVRYNESPKDTFFMNGEDFGGRVLEDEVDYDSIRDFNDFFDEKFGGYGGHPWGIYRGSSRTRIMLYPEKTDEGYYFRFSGDPNWNIRGIIKAYLALKRENAPVVFSFREETIRYIKEEDLIGMVSEYDMPVYCQSAFPNRKVDDFRNYDRKEYSDVSDKIEWQKIEEVKLKR